VKVRAAASVLAVLTLLTSGAPGVSANPGRAGARASTDRSWGARSVDAAIGDARTAADRHLLSTLPSATRVAFHAGTGRVRFLSGTPAAPLARAASLERIAGAAAASRSLAAAAAARAFLTRAGPLFGLARSNPTRDLTTERVSTGANGRTFVRFGQRRAGIPVLGGELIVQLDGRGDVISASGEALPVTDPLATTTPRIASASARRIAATSVAREAGTSATAVHTASEGLAILDSRILGGPALPNPANPALVWRIDARVQAPAQSEPVHRLVLVDARDGSVATSISRVAQALDRRICDFENVRRKDFRCSAPYTRSEGDPPSGGQVDDAYKAMGLTYAFYRDRFGRDGLDGNGQPMVATVRYCAPFACPLQTAFWEWGPQQTAFGNGWASADDVVAHEFTHGVQDHEARLFYYYQSGAVNESLADIFGEFVDLSNGYGDDRPAVRWKIGEDMPIGALRDMQEPGRFGDPDRVRSSRWWTSSADSGGVHENSGVGNKAASLMTDGGSFNGYSVRGIGLYRSALIWYELMTHLLTSAADYNDVYDGLQQACLNLVGTSGITFSDCGSVHGAVAATQMDLQPSSVAPRRATTCVTGRYPATVFADDLEHPESGNWTSVVLHGTRNPWHYPQNPNPKPDWDGTWASSGELNLYGADQATVTDAAIEMTTPVSLPPGAFLRFEHGFRFDAGPRRYDGGIVEISADGGPWKDLRPAFLQSGYNGRLAKGKRNPLGGRRAFTGDSLGWGASRVALSEYAGRSVRIRFRIATDRHVGDYGWYIDDVHIYRCVADDDRPHGSVKVAEGAAITLDRTVDVAIQGSDATTAVTRLRISNSRELRHGLLRYGMEMPFTDTVRWLLTDTGWGGRTGDGTHRVFVQLMDLAGNWSSVFQDDILLDALPPVVGSPAVRFVTGTQIASVGPPLPVRVSFSASDAGTGVAATSLDRSRDGGAWNAVDLGSPTGTSVSLRMSDDPTVEMRYRARARDGSGAWSAYRVGAALSAGALQEDAPGWTFAGSWERTTDDAAYGGAVAWASEAGARARLSFGGTDVALVGVRGPDRGIATIWLDGVNVATLDLYAPNPEPRLIVYAAHLTDGGQHTIAVHVTGGRNAASSGRRVDLDAAVVLGP
jgi:bacillolysin